MFSIKYYSITSIKHIVNQNKLLHSRFLSRNTPKTSKDEVLAYFKNKMGQRDVIPMEELTEILGKRLKFTNWLDRDERQEHIKSHKQVTPTTLEPRKLGSSFSSAIIPFSSNPRLQDRYVTFLGHIRIGRLMEDWDSFAVWIASNHLLGEDKRTEDISHIFQIVTLLVDSVVFSKFELTSSRDVLISGYTSWVSNSTIEVEMWMEQPVDGGTWDMITKARFLMAVRNPLTNKAQKIHQLITENDYEKNLLEVATKRRKAAREKEQTSIFNVGLTVDESAILHNLLYEKFMDEENFPTFETNLPKGTMLLENARMSSTIFSHPEDRNLYNNVFGGYIMRLAVELSWSCTFLHTRQEAILLAIDDIHFHQPVPVASLIRFRSFIVYTEDNKVVVLVYAFVHDPKTGESFRTNDFIFLYALNGPAPVIVPRSYESALMHFHGRRHLNEMFAAVEEFKPYMNT